jgi:Mg-chelatase subunit ChlD
MSDIEQKPAGAGVSSTSGIFQTKVPPGHYKITASADGYGLAVQRAEVKGRKTEVTVKLYPLDKPQELFPVPPAIAGPRWSPPPIWQPQPALIIGLGGTGRHVLSHLKKNLLDAGAGSLSDKVRLVLLDTSDYELLEGQKVAVEFAGVSLSAEDIVELGENLNPLKDALVKDPNSDPAISGWFPYSSYHKRLSPDELNLTNGTRQRRPPARALLVRDIQKGVPTGGVDVVLVIDHSSSMAETFSDSSETINKMDAAIKAAEQFIDQLDMSLDRVAVVQFNETAEIVQPFSQDAPAIKRSIEGIRPNGSTAMDVGLQIAQNVLGSIQASLPVVILLSDGQSLPEAALEQAQRLKDVGVRLITIGIGDVNDGLMKQIAISIQDNLQYYYAPNGQDLLKIYVTIARRLGEGSRIWRLLHNAARKAMDGSDLRIILVGSLAGGFGSAIAADIAYLSRLAGKKAGVTSPSVEAYLVTDGAFSQVTAHGETNAVNTYAALRELERFQLAQGYHCRMIYKHDAVKDPILFGTIDWRLMDEVYLFDTIPSIEPANSAQNDVWYQPSATIFPAIADMITLWLDKTARTGALNAHRRSIQSDVSKEQNALGRAVVGGAGIYVHRLPMLDIFEELKARWVRSLLHFLLVGNPDELVRVDASLNQEKQSGDISRQVQLFLIGCAGYEKPPIPAVVQLVGLLAYEGLYPELDDDIKRLEFAASFDEDAKAFRTYLNGALLALLNGLQSSSIIQARSGKLGYVLFFLNTVKVVLDQARNNLGEKHPQLNSLIVVYQNEVQAAQQSLRQQIALISQRFASEEQAESKGLYESLEDIEINCRARLKDLECILVRNYIIPSDQTLDRWYNDYFSDRAFHEEALSRLHWVERENEVALSLRSWNDHLLEMNLFSRENFLRELLRLAGFAGSNLLQKETLASVLEETVLAPKNITETAYHLMEHSKPVLRYDTFKAPQAKQTYILGANASIDLTTNLNNVLFEGLPDEKSIKQLEITDPFSLLLAQTVDVVPLNSIDSLFSEEISAEQTYRRWYGLLPRVGIDPHAEPSAVYRAESIALAFEQRLQSELYQATHILHPIIVTALNSDEAAVLFSQALAAGWVRRIGNEIFISADSNSHIWTANLAMDKSDLSSPYVSGFVRFSTEATPEQVNALRTALTTPNENVIASWQSWVGPDWRQHPLAEELLASGSAAADLACITSLIVRDELRQRSLD